MKENTKWTPMQSLIDWWMNTWQWVIDKKFLKGMIRGGKS
jgi:hypothetical protein